MNPKFLELAQQCQNPYSSFDIQLFGELVVAECLKTVKSAGLAHGDSITPVFVVDSVINAIRTRFEVEK
jgi:hypothetical protein